MSIEEEHATLATTVFNLSDVIQHKNTLTEVQKDAFISLFGKGCRAKRVEALRRAINSAVFYRDYGIYKRVVFLSTAPYCKYQAGQSYPDEVRTVREAFTKGY